MNILISASENYLTYAKTMLHSLRLTNTEPVHVYLMYVEMDDAALSRFSDFLQEELEMEFTAVPVDYSSFEGMPIGRHYSIEIYNRLLAQYLLPPAVERILYLDVDMIIRGDLTSFYNQPMPEKVYLTVCVDWNYQTEQMKMHQLSLGLPREYRYFNSGVLLMDLNKLRADITAGQVFAATKMLAERLKFPDQDVLNYMYEENIQYADEKIYNFQAFDLHPLAFSSRKNIILHYAGIQKPWDFRFINRYSRYYWSVACKEGQRFKMVRVYALSALYRPAVAFYHLLRKIAI